MAAGKKRLTIADVTRNGSITTLIQALTAWLVGQRVIDEIKALLHVDTLNTSPRKEVYWQVVQDHSEEGIGKDAPGSWPSDDPAQQ